MPGYGVKIVADDEMPSDYDWVFAKKPDGAMILVLTRSAANCERALAEAWAAYRRMSTPTTDEPRVARYLSGVAKAIGD